MRKPKFYYYDKDICKQVASLCGSRREFYIKYPAAHNAAQKNGWLDEFIPTLKKDKNYWTFEKCKEESLKYKTKKEFKEKCESAYKKILKNKWDKELFNHLTPVGNLKKRLVYAQEFSDKSVYIGLTGNIQKRTHNHLNLKKETIFKHIQKTGIFPTLKLLTDYIPIEDAIKKEHEFVNEYKKENWNVLNIAKTGGVGKVKTKWTIDVILSESLKYNSKSEFKKNSYNAYCAMYKLKCQDIVCEHMIKKRKRILQTTINGDIVGEFNSILDAHNKTGIRYSSIFSCCERKYKTGGGYVWSYVICL